jgi:hypothetical protein
MDSAIRFFNWAYKTRANTVKAIDAGENMDPNKMFLSFCSHDPTLITNGPAGLNASIKGIGFVPKKELLEDILEKEYIPHIKTYDPEDKTYSERGLKILIKNLYCDEAAKNIDFTVITTLEMAKNHTYKNLLATQDEKGGQNATLSFYQPPAIAFEVRGHCYLTEDIYQRFVNAQHDMYHAPNMERWPARPAIVFQIQEVYDNSANKQGFGAQLEYPCPEWK